MAPGQTENNLNGAGILWHTVAGSADAIVMRGLIAVKFDPAIKGKKDIRRLRFRVFKAPDFPIESHFSIRKGLPFGAGYRLYAFTLKILKKDALQLDVQNKIYLYYDDIRMCGVVYRFLKRQKGEFHNSRLFRAGDKVMYFRQTINNKLWFVVRPENLYDAAGQRLRVSAAWLVSKIKGPSQDVLMFEKEASRYEESASVLYERLIDQGYPNIWYIINRDNPRIPSMKPQYREHLIYKDSFRHLVAFLRCRKFVGTENIDHAMQLRAANRHLMAKMQSTDLTQVFLQHGVMYMVSLDADMRVFFSNHNLKQYRAVVSSEAEALHFVRLGGFRREDMYVTGLAKFDRSRREEDADLIMIMPTWRRWETNLARKDFEATGYYRMLERIVRAVPDHLQEKIVIKPHPLMEEMMTRERTALARFLRPDLSHNDTLEKTRLLITDYSSIAYDAFYRGTNVIFYWEEKEECMRRYGNAHLMINEYNIFGDICYSSGQLEKVVEKNYTQTQDPLYQRRYRNIVSFHDGRNTERIIEKLKKDGII
ncbi:MAG: CDP-glycerol glycerophosphotransferase family protein [Firmicutes bacterium]|nr:CDP-glycerol glycerophosphotransferase family protein [Bacillota bacterium]